MLTVARLSAEAARERYTPGMTVPGLWDIVVREADAALRKTPELLPVLKKAGVVGAGGQGLLLIYQGMKSVFDGRGIVPSNEEEAQPAAQPQVTDAAGELELEDLTYPYCTEFIVLKEDKNADSLKLRAYLESIGDSAVVVDDDEIIKCHVHTDNPGLAIQKALEFGMLNKIKIDNMWIQHDVKKKAVTAKAQNKVAVDPDQPFGFVAVAAGDGVKQLFLDLGVHQVVSGGQTMNPSTEDILREIARTPAEVVFVLPNNKNIIMAAQQCVGLVEGKEVVVIPTRTVPQGISAMLVLDPEADTEANAAAMEEARKNVRTSEITYAARDSDFDGFEIHEGDYMALAEGQLFGTDRAIGVLLERLAKADSQQSAEFISIFYGEDVAEDQADEALAIFQKECPNAEITLLSGGQPVYYYMISAE